MHLSAAHPIAPSRPSLHTAEVCDRFGLHADLHRTGTLVVADGLEVPAAPAGVTLLTGPSGSGKSSLLRAAVAAVRSEHGENAVVDVAALELPDRPLTDALGLPFADGLSLLARCGLAEPRLLLRTPAELSDGQRFRFRLAFALARRPDGNRPHLLAVDEFTAVLDRTLARVVAFNVRRLSDATGTGFLLATTHDDVAADLRPDVHVRCRLDGRVEVGAPPSRGVEPPGSATRTPLGPLFAPNELDHRVSFARDLHLTTATRGDWPAFAGWHYRSHQVGVVRAGTLLWHGDPATDGGAEPVGICLFCTAPLSLAGRNKYFGTGRRWSSASVRTMNARLAILSRVVLHPTYRGAGVASRFVRASCRHSGFAWVETLTALGAVHPVFERAGFVRVDVDRTDAKPRDRAGHGAIYGVGRGPAGRRKKSPLSAEAHAKSEHAAPVYFILDNRAHAGRHAQRPGCSEASGTLTGDAAGG